MTDVVDGEAIAGRLHEGLRGPVETLAEAGHPPTLATVLMSDDPADERFVELKGDACDALGVGWVDRRVDPTATTGDLLGVVDALNGDPGVDGVFVQLPLPDHVPLGSARAAIDPAKDVDCLSHENLGRLVGGDPWFVPATPGAVQHLLAAAGVETAGAHVVLVGRSAVVGTPLANMLLWRGSRGDATVTVCHSRTSDLGAVTRRADVLVSGARVPGLVDGSMLSAGVAVVDVGGARVPAENDRGYRLVGDVDVESARGKASVVAPVPGGVGPVTVEMLLRNVVAAASRRAGVPVDLPRWRRPDDSSG